MGDAKRDAGRAMMRGLRGRCPVCGRGRLFSSYLRPAARCDACGENLAPYQTADFASYIVMFLVGLVATPFVVATAFAGGGAWIIAAVMVGSVVLALILLPRAKGAVIALLWALDIQSNI
jgi:uncharacterized protein (DUF983 family)